LIKLEDTTTIMNFLSGFIEFGKKQKLKDISNFHIIDIFEELQKQGKVDCVFNSLKDLMKYFLD